MVKLVEYGRADRRSVKATGKTVGEGVNSTVNFCEASFSVQMLENLNRFWFKFLEPFLIKDRPVITCHAQSV